ncbi:hypothetical protein M5K25_020544 [Dendrobium thyrsiflorum]|uniref:Uncharacterized protein n=1 Tax=Dendrobium thyrsiflorum TaxID=117978 RepID=A0ABD0UH58_DENTH
MGEKEAEWGSCEWGISEQSLKGAWTKCRGRISCSKLRFWVLVFAQNRVLGLEDAVDDENLVNGCLNCGLTWLDFAVLGAAGLSAVGFPLLAVFPHAVVLLFSYYWLLVFPAVAA